MKVEDIENKYHMFEGNPIDHAEWCVDVFPDLLRVAKAARKMLDLGYGVDGELHHALENLEGEDA
jgi:hypothetical protein